MPHQTSIHGAFQYFYVNYVVLDSGLAILSLFFTFWILLLIAGMTKRSNPNLPALKPAAAIKIASKISQGLLDIVPAIKNAKFMTIPKMQHMLLNIQVLTLGRLKTLPKG